MQYKLDLKSAVALLLLAGMTLRADTLADKGRDIFTKNQHAVVTVQLVQKAAASNRSGNGGPHEAKLDITGTVVDPSGLTVVALSSADPSELYRRLSEDYKMEIELSEVKILMEDGTEMPAEIVLRDKDLDLAFIRPKAKPATPMAAVDLSKSGKAQVLDELITLNRLKRGAGRAFSASVERISAVVQKPRTFYVPDNTQTETGLGSPAFTLDGNVLGLVVMRAVNSMGAAKWQDCMTSIILPAEDIAKAAAQAPADVKQAEEKKDAAKDSKEPAAATPAAPKEPVK